MVRTVDRTDETVASGPCKFETVDVLDLLRVFRAFRSQIVDGVDMRTVETAPVWPRKTPVAGSPGAGVSSRAVAGYRLARPTLAG